ncbi:MAG: hypothetical protein JW828_13465 [Sedimentisphaerales bacterium]|nr:hypothetical protein [Sedimentisphaerales bacterium]
MRSWFILFLAAVAPFPAFCAVTFTAVDNGNGQVKIIYVADPGDAPSGVALRVTIVGATVAPDGVVAVDSAFNTFIDYAASNPGNFQVGDGHPLALATEAGALTMASSDFSISMGVLDETGNQFPAGESADPLIILQLVGEGTDNVTICADTLRGPDSGVVGANGPLESNLQAGCITVDVNGWETHCDCYRRSVPGDYEEAVSVGCPVSWCASSQCYGDANGQEEQIGKGMFTVGFKDINILLEGFGKAYSGYANAQSWIAADFDHRAEKIGKGFFRVGFNDINILLEWFAKPNVPNDCN